jgi:hypothetical protein
MEAMRRKRREARKARELARLLVALDDAARERGGRPPRRAVVLGRLR